MPTLKMSKKALLMVDLQNDFCPGGALAVAEGDKIIPLANQIQDYFSLILASKDWHPKDHLSFAKNHPQHSVGEVITLNQQAQVLWPIHCVQHEPGAQFHPALETKKINKIIYKGTNKCVDSYSAFFDNKKLQTTDLYAYLQTAAVTDIYVLGLTTDYCVKFTCLDAIELRFNVYLIQDACRGVNLQAQDSKQAILEMAHAGVNIINSQMLSNP